MSTSHIDCTRPSSYTSASFVAGGAVDAQSIDSAPLWVQGEVAASLHRASELESREKSMVVALKVEQAFVPGAPEEIRERVVAEAVDVLLHDLGVSELIAVVGAILARVMAEEKGTIGVVSASLGHQGSLSVRLVTALSTAPNLVAVGVERLVQEASPALWSEILKVLEAPREESARE